MHSPAFRGIQALLNIIRSIYSGGKSKRIENLCRERIDAFLTSHLSVTIDTDEEQNYEDLS